MNVVFTDRRHNFEGILKDREECLGSALEIFGVPAAVFNLRKVMAKRRVASVSLPEDMAATMECLGAAFPSVDVSLRGLRDFTPRPGDLELPLNSIVMGWEGDELVMREVVNPWDLVSAVCGLLERDVTTTSVSPDAEISETARLTGPCVIEAGATIDDFCKIRGPVYIGRGTRVGTGCLIRNSVIGADSVIGFSCEIARSYLAGRNTAAHLDVILDSVIGQNTWLGGYVGTTNVLLNLANVKYKLGDALVDTGLSHFGAVIGHGSAIGAGVLILPGRCVPPGSVIQAGEVYKGNPIQTKA